MSVPSHVFCAALERRFVDFHDVTVECLSAKEESTVFLVEGHWVFKVPSGEDAVLRSRQEVSLLTALPGLVVRIPRPVFHGVPALDLPVPFFGYPKLDGRPASDSASSDWMSRAIEVLSEVHRLKPAFALNRSTVRPDGGRRDPTTDVPSLRPSLRWLSQNRPGGFVPTLCHGRASSEHWLLNDDGEVSGLLDWSHAAIGDPAFDLAELLLWEPEAAERAWGEREPAVLERAWRHALWLGVHRVDEASGAVKDDWLRRVLRLQRLLLGGA